MRCVQTLCPDGGVTVAVATTASRTDGPCTAGRPGRGRSNRPGIPRAANRAGQSRAVGGEQPTTLTISAGPAPVAASSTIRARRTRRCSLLPAARIWSIFLRRLTVIASATVRQPPPIRRARSRSPRPQARGPLTGGRR